MTPEPPRTPDGRYIVVDGRLWRATNPALAEGERERLTRELMAARRDVGIAMRASDAAAERAARSLVNAAKIALGERGAVWWEDEEPDFNRKMAANSPYADWFASLGRDAT